MSVGEWVILGIAIVTIAFFVIVIIKASIKKNLVNVVNTEEENFCCHQGVVISKKVMGSYCEGLHQPKTVIQYGAYFLLKDGKEKLYLLPENIFKQIREGMHGNLYIKNNVFFDFEEME